LAAAETALEEMYQSLTVSPGTMGTAGAFLDRLTDLSARAARLERMLDSMDWNDEPLTNVIVC